MVFRLETLGTLMTSGMAQDVAANALAGVTPAFFVDLPLPFKLRSLTINPTFVDDDDPDKIVQFVVNTLAMRPRDSNARSSSPIVWFEAQIHLNRIDQDDPKPPAALSVPQIRILVSKQFGEMNSQYKAKLIMENSRTLGIVNATTRDDANASLESAFGWGARNCTARVDYPTTSNSEFVAIRRPHYADANVGEAETCYFTVAVVESIENRGSYSELLLSLLPIDRTTRCPTCSELSIQTGESVSFWFPLVYPHGISDLTRDERRFLTLRAGWPMTSPSHNVVELLSFPRLASKYRLLSSNPGFTTSPALPHDPEVWGAGSGTTFALESIGLKAKTNSGFSELGIFLSVEDGKYRELIQIQQIFASVFFGVIIGTLLSSAVAPIFHDLTMRGGILLSAVGLVVLAAFVLLLIPRGHLNE